MSDLIHSTQPGPSLNKTQSDMTWHDNSNKKKIDPSRRRHASRFRKRNSRESLGVAGWSAGGRAWCGGRGRWGGLPQPARPLPGMLSRFQFVLPVGLFLTRKLFSPPAHGCVVGDESEGNTDRHAGLLLVDWRAWSKWNPQKMRFRSSRRTRAVGSTRLAFLVSPSDGRRA